LHAEVGIVDGEAAARRQRRGAIYHVEAALEQPAIDIHASPSLPVVRVSDIELRPRVSLGGVGALERGACLGELIAAKEAQAVIEARAVDGIRAEAGRHAAGDLPDRL